MYKNRKYRSGTSSLVRTTSSFISSTPLEKDAADADSVSNAADPIPSASNRVLTDRANVIQEEGDDGIGPSPKVSTKKRLIKVIEILSSMDFLCLMLSFTLSLQMQ